MADLFIVKRQLKLSLWFVGTALAGGLLASWDAWRQIGPVDDQERFLLFATVTGGLALAWLVLWGVYLSADWFMRPMMHGKKVSRIQVPWWALKYIVLLLFIGSMAAIIPGWSNRMANEFTLLEKGKLEKLAERIAEDPQAMERTDPHTGKTLLVLALESGNTEAVDLLLSSGAKLESTADGSNWVIAALPHPTLLKTLLAHGADPNAPDAAGNVPIHYAIETQNTNALTTLLEYKADANARDLLYQTPLLLVIEAGNIPVAETLLKYGADPNLWDQRGDTALHKAILRNNVEAARFLLEHGANPKLFNFSDLSPLHLAALHGQDELVKLLLEQPELIHLHNETDLTAFDYALRGRKYETAKLLLERGAEIDRMMADGYTAIHLMVMAKEYRSAQFLIEEGADVHIADADGESTYDLMRRKQLQTLLDLVEARDLPQTEETPKTADESVDEP